MSLKKSDKNSKFLDALKAKTKELGSEISTELLENINLTTTLLQASLGNELHYHPKNYCWNYQCCYCEFLI